MFILPSKMQRVCFHLKNPFTILYFESIDFDCEFRIPVEIFTETAKETRAN
jgi:hypothetical protein